MRVQFFFSKMCTPTLGPNQPLIKFVPGYYPGGKAAGDEDNHSPTSTAEGISECSYKFPLPCVLKARTQTILPPKAQRSLHRHCAMFVSYPDIKVSTDCAMFVSYPGIEVSTYTVRCSCLIRALKSPDTAMFVSYPDIKVSTDRCSCLIRTLKSPQTAMFVSYKDTKVSTDTNVMFVS